MTYDKFVNGLNSLTDPAILLLMFGLLFLGYFFGWFFRGKNIVMMIIGVVLFSSVLEWLIKLDYWITTVPFVLGFGINFSKRIQRAFR